MPAPPPIHDSEQARPHAVPNPPASDIPTSPAATPTKTKTQTHSPANQHADANPRPRFFGRTRALAARLWHSLVSLHGSPHDIALGAALGMFIAFTPTFGIQMFLAFIITSIFGASRAAAMVTTWVTNVFTMAPFYACTYLVGSLFWPGADAPFHEAHERMSGFVSSVAHFEGLAMWAKFKAMLSLGAEMFIPMTIGGLLVGAVAGLATYPIALWGVNRYRRVRETLRHALHHEHHHGKHKPEDASPSPADQATDHGRDDDHDQPASPSARIAPPDQSRSKAS